MTVTCTSKEIWKRYDELKKEYLRLTEGAEEDDVTLAQFAGSEKLATMLEELEDLLADSDGIANDSERDKMQSDVSRMLYTVDSAMSDAFLFECDNAADFADYVSSR